MRYFFPRKESSGEKGFDLGRMGSYEHAARSKASQADFKTLVLCVGWRGEGREGERFSEGRAWGRGAEEGAEGLLSSTRLLGRMRAGGERRVGQADAWWCIAEGRRELRAVEGGRAAVASSACWKDEETESRQVL